MCGVAGYVNYWDDVLRTLPHLAEQVAAYRERVKR